MEMEGEMATAHDICTGILTKGNSKGRSNFVSRYHIMNPDVIKIDHVRQI